MIRVIFLFFTVINSLLGQNFPKKFTISGKIAGIGNEKVLLANKGIGYTEATNIIYFDSCFAQNDSFYFHGTITEPSFYSIEAPSFNSGWRYFINDGSDIKIYGHKDSIYNSKVYGSKEHDSFIDYRIKYYLPHAIKLNSYMDLHRKAARNYDTATSKVYLDSSWMENSKIINTALSFVKNNPNKFVSLFILNHIFIRKVPLKDLKKHYKLLSKDLQNHSLGKSLEVKIYHPANVGSKIRNIKVPDLENNKISMINHKSKYTLINFWASWCAPCIKEFPELKSIYNKYDRSQLEIVGISLDINKENMINAVNKHEIKWKILSDFKGNESDVCSMFAVSSIPKLYLINRKRRIVLSDVRIDQLSSSLNEIITIKKNNQ